jgi:hypothetical protein
MSAHGLARLREKGQEQFAEQCRKLRTDRRGNRWIKGRDRIYSNLA